MAGVIRKNVKTFCLFVQQFSFETPQVGNHKNEKKRTLIA